MTETQIRAIVRPIRDGGPISRFYATGEIQPGLIPALGAATVDLDDTSADEVDDVISYVAAVGERPPVTGWPL
ncbi:MULTISPECIES: hypothetical protein [Streptomyces]|uniref:Uncharacterized protein n=1 Tax=Streptomyces doudnae TaxID=3075536 RepID=A0ABD5ELX6_9ACTN|nr:MULTISPECIES: hypothetical protein [unclassified Streptomyces]MDT0435656.1 hypothetical protein [Streptomyces sp. DSM 41981]MYQ62611.1 hypothetical protein [Streptomyces sp. SID4950]SCD40739.1 hypothetical protein GA0115242_1048115 [Streptomyces sp. SolWspMP-5a-2]